MALEYERVKVGEKRQMIDARLAQFEAEHYSHTLNAVALNALPDSDDKTAGLAANAAALATLESTILTHRAERDKLTPKP